VQIGLVGSGNMARALALGWGEPVLCTDAGSGRAQELAALVGGRAVASNRELAEQSDVVVLAHKPAQLDAVAREIGGAARLIVSIVARTTQAELRAAYPETPVFRIEPNTPVEVRRGVLAFATPDTDVDPDALATVRELFGRLGTIVEIPESLMRIAGATGGVGPAYWSLIVEAQIDTAIRRGMPQQLAATLVTETMAGSAELLRAREHDTLALRRAVTSPGGTTARGLAALERGGVRAAFAQAMDDVVDFT
jgi:pyrroline-5-carboxylate reductase